MTSIPNAVVDLMRRRFEEAGEYRNTTTELRHYLKSLNYFNSVSATAVSSAVHNLKKRGIIVDLNQRVPGTANARYFALAEHLEVMRKKGAHVVSEDKPTPNTVAPFEKILTVLGEIKAQLGGLANGYSQSVETLRSLNLEQLNAILGDIKDSVTLTPESVNNTLQDKTDKDAFIYAVRTEVRTEVADYTDQLAQLIESELGNLRHSLAKSATEAYARGVKDGIQMALELKLKIDT